MIFNFKCLAFHPLFLHWNVNSFFFLVNYSLNPTSKLNYFGHVGSYDGTIQFWLRGKFPLCRPSSRGFPLCRLGLSQDRHDNIPSPNSRIVKEIMTNATFEGNDRKKMKKPHFLFGDKIELSEDFLFDGNYKWLRQVQGQYMFLPNMEHSYLLSYLQAVLVPRKMN